MSEYRRRTIERGQPPFGGIYRVTNPDGQPWLTGYSSYVKATRAVYETLRIEACLRYIDAVDKRIIQEIEIHRQWAAGDMHGKPGVGRKPHFRLGVKAITDQYRACASWSDGYDPVRFRQIGARREKLYSASAFGRQRAYHYMIALGYWVKGTRASWSQPDFRNTLEDALAL